MILLSSTVCKPLEEHTGETFSSFGSMSFSDGVMISMTTRKTQYEHQLVAVSLNYGLARLVAAQAAVQ